MKKNYKTIAAILVIAALAVYGIAQQSSSEGRTISTADAYQMLQNDTTVVLLDVRTPGEHTHERIADAPLIPVQELEERIGELDTVKDRTIIVYCRTGNRSGTATSLLRERGFSAVNMVGGIVQWKSEQRPTLRGGME